MSRTRIGQVAIDANIALSSTYKITGSANATADGDLVPLSQVKSLIADKDFQESVLDKDLTTPPGSPATGARYWIGASPTGGWSGHGNTIGEYTGSAWLYTTPDEGTAFVVEDENLMYWWDGDSLNSFGEVVDHTALINKGTNTHAQIDTHIADTANPHATTKTHVGLGNVTDDAQLKRADADWGGFTAKAVAASTDRRLIESADDSYAKRIGTVIGDAPALAGMPDLVNPLREAAIVGLMPSFMNHSVFMLTPQGSATLSTIGWASSTVGTVSHPTLATTNYKTARRRFSITSAASGNSAASIVLGANTGVGTFVRGNAAGIGGFLFHCRFSMATDQATVANERMFVGLWSSTSAFATTTDPDAMTECIGVGFKTGQANLQLIRNDNTSTANFTDLGSSFPAFVSATTYVYELWLYCKPNDSHIYYVVNRLDSAASANGDLTTEIPQTTTMLCAHLGANNGGTAVACAIDGMRMTVVTGS